MARIPMIFAEAFNGVTSGTYTVPAGKYAVVNAHTVAQSPSHNPYVSINGGRVARASGYTTSYGASASAQGIVCPAGTTILAFSHTSNCCSIASGFLYDLPTA